MLTEKSKQAQNEGAKAGEGQTAPEAAPVQEGKETPPAQAAPMQDAKKVAPKTSKKAHSKAGKNAAPKASKKAHKKTAPKAGKKSASKASKKAKREDGTMSGLDAAAKILGKAGKPLNVKEIMERIQAQGLWKSGGKTPHATISAAITREINNKKSASRFHKAERGRFELKK
jgi:hypothetical protein